MDKITVTNLWISFVLALGSALPGASLAQGMQVVDAWSRPTPPGSETGVVYFTLRNSGKSDRLVRVSTPIAKVAEMHLTSVTNGVTRMRSLSSVEVGSGTPLSFEPNGRHVMLMGLKRPLKAGEEFPLVLTFANAGPVDVRVRVRGLGDAAGREGMDNSRR